MASKQRSTAGFSLIELLIVVAIMGVVAAVATPALLRAKVSGNEASAIASTRAVETAQRSFASTCGGGFYSDSLAALATPPPSGGQGFVTSDIGTDGIEKSGYVLNLMPGNPVIAPIPVCNNTTLTDSYAFVADPAVQGSTGNRYFFSNGGSNIWQDEAPFPPVYEGPPGQGSPLQ
jgi:prepilin-type N-terminal cleavage/methylation domain-containing protein